jgi:hypothetical protein
MSTKVYRVLHLRKTVTPHPEFEFEANSRTFRNAGADFFDCNNAGFSLLLHLMASKKIESWQWVRRSWFEIVELFKILLARGLGPIVEDAC